MLKFFRKIRFDLLNKNKTGKYLKYAIGEILLVTIGILLALQINNWNENRKNSSEEIKILYELKDNLQANVKNLNRRISEDSLVIERGDLLLSILKDNNSIYDDSMDVLFGSIGTWFPVNIKHFAYENLKAKGISILTSDTLRSEVTSVFDDSFTQLEVFEELFMKTYVGGLNIKHKYLEAGKNFQKMQPNNFDLLKESNEFKNFLAYSIASSRTFRGYYKNDILEKTIVLLKNIEEEIAKLEN